MRAKIAVSGQPCRPGPTVAPLSRGGCDSLKRVPYEAPTLVIDALLYADDREGVGSGIGQRLFGVLTRSVCWIYGPQKYEVGQPSGSRLCRATTGSDYSWVYCCSRRPRWSWIFERSECPHQKLPSPERGSRLLSPTASRRPCSCVRTVPAVSAGWTVPATIRSPGIRHERVGGGSGERPSSSMRASSPVGSTSRHVGKTLRRLGHLPSRKNHSFSERCPTLRQR